MSKTGTFDVPHAGIVSSANMPVFQTGEVGAAPTTRSQISQIYLKHLFLAEKN